MPNQTFSDVCGAWLSALPTAPPSHLQGVCELTRMYSKRFTDLSKPSQLTAENAGDDISPKPLSPHKVAKNHRYEQGETAS